MGLQITVKKGQAFWIDKEPIIIEDIGEDGVQICDGDCISWERFRTRVQRGALLITYIRTSNLHHVGVYLVGKGPVISRRSPIEHCCERPLIDVDRQDNGTLVAGCDTCEKMYILFPRPYPCDPYQRLASSFTFTQVMRLLLDRSIHERREIKRALQKLWESETWRDIEPGFFSVIYNTCIDD